MDRALRPAIETWLSRFNAAAADPAAGALAGLFLDDSHWRDAVGLGWELVTVSGRSELTHKLAGALKAFQAREFAIDPKRCAPRVVERAGLPAIEAILQFETKVGRCAGLVRFRQDQPDKAWTLHTALDQIRGHEETTLRAARDGVAFQRDFHGPSWLDRRSERDRFLDRDPAVLVVGGGHAGLSAAARLGQLNIDTLVIDREKRIGDNWRLRYRALHLHNTYHSNHLPYLPFPPTFQS